tara:strand:+ start:127 stop:546 length:420 start_codon:yes stop_codon:yes gene_type:complete
MEDCWNKTRDWLNQSLNCLSPPDRRHYDVENPSPELVENYRLQTQLHESSHSQAQHFSLISNRLEAMSNRLEHLEFDNRSKSRFKKNLENLEEKITIRIDTLVEEPRVSDELSLLKQSLQDLDTRVGKLTSDSWVNVGN